MKVENLVSTMNLEDYDTLISNLNIDGCVVINQITTNVNKIKDISKGKNKLFSYKEIGLSKSRNKAIKNSNADICIISDDDLTYNDDYKDIILNGYKKYPNADIIAFYVDNYDKNRRKKKKKERKINYLTSMQLQSVQITFKRKSVINNNISFDERFGAGAELNMGEENIFLYDCLRKGLKIYYIPKNIAFIKNNESTWFKGYNKDYFIVKGAQFYRMSKYMYIPLILQFAFRKRKLYKDNFNIIEIVKFMLEGSREFKRNEGIKYGKKE